MLTVQGRVPARARLMAVPLDGDAAVMDVAESLSARTRPAFLHGSWFGGGAILASDPAAWVSGNGSAALAALDAQPAIESVDAPAGTLGGGFLGCLGYRSLAEGALEGPSPVAMAFHDNLLRHDGSRWIFEMLWTPERSSQLDAALARSRRLVAGGAGAHGGPRAARATLDHVVRPDAAEHIAAVTAAKDLIARGGMYQANICTELRAVLRGSPFALWRQLVDALSPSHAAFLPTDRGISVGASPELFLRRDGDAVATAPIKGTRPRFADPPRDTASRAELAASAKDRAENVMIVDLMRNDLGRVARIGSVRPADLLRVTPGAGVWHLASLVHATLREDVSDSALLRATFPPGSVTGAPKIAAMAAITRWERAPRRLYTGAVGLLTPTRGLELAVVIRTFEIDGQQVRLGIGGGITEGSDPQAEYEECLVKAAPLLRAADG